MKRTRIFVNSASDIGPETAREFGITVIPDTIIINGQVFYNGIDITPAEFYERARGLSVLPTTSHPNIDMYCSCFETAQDCDEILCLTITSRMSGSYSTACIARDDMKKRGFKPEITVYDTYQVTYGIAFMAIEAAKRAMLGETAQEICAFLDALKGRLRVYGLLYSLKNAVKGGRIGAIKALCADALNVKPIVEVTEGTLHDIALVRGFQAGQNKLLKFYRENADYSKDVAIFHGNNAQSAQNLRAQIRMIAPDAVIRIEWIGSVIGNYTGEKSMGLAFERKDA